MNKKIYFLAIAAMALSLGSCDKANEGDDSSSKYISVSTEITNMTRVSTNANGGQSFEDGDKISVYAWTGDKDTAPVAANRIVDNSINTLNGSAWSASPQMLWKDTQTDHYFIGIYPSSATSIADLSKGQYTFDVNDQEASDLLVAVNAQGIKSSGNPVPLTFKHVMAKLVVNLSFRNQWGGQNPIVTKVTVNGAATQATVNYLTQTVTASTTGKKDIDLPKINKEQQYTSILIPQSGVNRIDVAIGSTNYSYFHQGDIPLGSGKYTTVSLIVGRDRITLGEISISDWEKGETFSGEAQ